jgi:diguanylate cyclase (GGDEF)-like protein/PAS domain S-box-containing protein
MSLQGSDEHSAGSVVALVHALLAHTDDLVLAVDADLGLSFVNAAIERLSGSAGAALLGRSVAQAGLFGTQAAVVHESLAAVRNGAPPASFEIELQCNAGAPPSRYAVALAAERSAAGALQHVLLRARNVSEQRRVESDLRVREAEFRTLAENSPDNIIRYGLDGRAVYCNREIEERVPVEARKIVGRTAREGAPPGMLGITEYEAQLMRTLASGERGTVELTFPHPEAGVRVHSVVIAAEHDASGGICGAVAVGRDVTEPVRVREALAEKEREFRSLAENAGDNIVRWDLEGRMRYVNPAMARFFSRPAEDLIGCTPIEVDIDGRDRYRAVYDTVRECARSGRPSTLEVRVPPLAGRRAQVHEVRFVPERDDAGRVCSVLGIGRDVTEKIEQLEIIESLVRTDPLTRLANRQALQERAPAIFSAAGRHAEKVGVMLLDLDEFKAINDGMGHSAGDALLVETGRRLTACMRANDLLVRLGGDEFVIVAPDIADPEVLGTIAAKVQRELGRPLRLNERDVHVTASIGVAVFPTDGAGLEPLLAHADSAMYHAKRSGRARTEYYRRELSDAVQRRLLIEASLRAACHGAGLELYYQPQVCLSRPRHVVGAEALLRWHHPQLGLLAPDAFIPLAEETGLIVPIGRWVLRSAAAAAARWNRDRSEPVVVAVNVSSRQFVLDDLPAVVQTVLHETGCAPGWLAVEITESALVDDFARVAQVLDALRGMGLRSALDDFGTGYSALNYLVRLRVDCLKIDKSFVQGIAGGDRERELVKAFIAMAAALRLAVVAEGVETPEQAAFLQAHGCESGQGYLFGRPLVAERFEALLRPLAAVA